MKRIGILHGAILNGGDYLICKRGTKLLDKFLGSKFEFVHVKRWEPFKGNFDALIILGGPIVSRSMHIQSRRIMEYMDNKEIPVIALGVGISGEYFDSVDDYFIDESLEFWKNIYESSGLISVRDEETYLLLKHFGINARLTGCPALFDLDNINKMDKDSKNIKKEKMKISLTIPDLSMNIMDIKSYNMVHVKSLLLSIFFVNYIKLIFKLNKINGEYYLVLQHGFNHLISVIAVYCKLLGIKTIDASKRSLDELADIKASDIHVGTRLHSHILFSAARKPSYLFNVDYRTKAFLETFNYDYDINFSPSGIKKLANLASKELNNAVMINNRVAKSNESIYNYFEEMSAFLADLNIFLGCDDLDNVKIPQVSDAATKKS